MIQRLGKDSFDRSLILIKISLWLAGVNVFHNNEKFLSKDITYLFYVNFIWLYTGVSGELYCIYGLIKEGKSLEEISIVAPFPLICALGTIKAASIFINKHAAVTVLKKLREIHPDILVIDEKYFENHKVPSDIQKRIRIIDSTKKVLSKFVICMYLGVIFVVILFCVVPLTSMAMDYNKFGWTNLKLPYHVRYFYDPYSMPWWPGEYIHHVGCSVIVCVNLFGADALLYTFCLYLRMHFEILSIDFERLTDSNKELRELVLRHQNLIELVNEVQNIYSTSMLFNIIISSFTICFCGFNITIISDVGTSFAFLSFLLMSLYQIFMLCFFGDMISVSSTKIGDAIYKNKWYEAKPAFKRSLFIIIMRFVSIYNIEQFTGQGNCIIYFLCIQILSHSWSYFALLRTLYR